MKSEKATLGKLVSVARPRGAAGKQGNGKVSFSTICGTERIPMHGVIERIYPRFAVLGMLVPGDSLSVESKRLYRESFFWEELSEA